MSDFEPGDTMVEAFRRANPVPAEQTVGRRSLPSAHALFADIVAQPQRRVARRVRRRVFAIAIAIVLIALLVAAFVVVRRDRASAPASVVCYAAADLQAPRVVVADIPDPARACAKEWADGRFGAGAVPGLDVCVLPSGVPAVFPGEAGSVCARLDLPSASASPRDNSLSQFTAALGRRVQAKCVGDTEAEKIVERALARRRFKDWTIKRPARAFDAGRLCASLGIDLPSQTIAIVPEPNPFVPPPS